jgi:hypothetical protein
MQAARFTVVLATAVVLVATALLAWELTWGRPRLVVTGEPAKQFLPPADTVAGMRVILPGRLSKGGPPLVVPAGRIPGVLDVLGRAKKFECRNGYEWKWAVDGELTLSLQSQGEFPIVFGMTGTSKLVFGTAKGSFLGDSFQELLDALPEADKDP